MIYAPGVKLQELARGLWRWTASHLDSPEALRRQLLVLPGEMVLVSHGEPELRDRRRELERALP
jgi:hypothetical protein